MAVEGGQTGVIAANADTANVLAGKTWEFIPLTWRRGANVRVAAIAGLAASLNCTASLKVGDRSVADKTAVSYDSVARGVKMSDDIIMTAYAPAGARLLLTFNGGAAGAAAPGVNWKIEVDPL